MRSQNKRKMKVCRIAQNELVFLGIGPYDPNKKSHYNKFIFVYIILTSLSFTQTTAYLFLEANTFDEVTQCIYIISASVLSPMAVGSLALQQNVLFKLLERIEAILDASRCKKIFENVPRNITFKYIFINPLNEFK